MDNEQSGVDQRFTSLNNEVREGYAQIMADLKDGTIRPADLKKRKAELRKKEREVKHLFDEARKAARTEGKPKS